MSKCITQKDIIFGEETGDSWWSYPSSFCWWCSDGVTNWFKYFLN